jgi:hypothetical protein
VADAAGVGRGDGVGADAVGGGAEPESMNSYCFFRNSVTSSKPMTPYSAPWWSRTLSRYCRCDIWSTEPLGQVKVDSFPFHLARPANMSLARGMTERASDGYTRRKMTPRLPGWRSISSPM